MSPFKHDNHRPACEDAAEPEVAFRAPAASFIHQRAHPQESTPQPHFEQEIAPCRKLIKYPQDARAVAAGKKYTLL